AAGDYTAASTYYAHAVNTHPESYYAYLSLVELLSYGTPVAELQRGLVDYHAEQYTPAILAFRRYLQANPTHDARVHLYLALSHRALENIPAAKTHLLEIIQTHPGDPLWVDAALELAYTQWGWEENYSGAIATLLNAVEGAPSHSTAPEALFDAGRVAERGADLQLAATLWGRVANEYPNSYLAPRAAFLSGISLYRQGEYSDSIPHFVQAGSF
ncbi:MAG: tetratricopeptide repeat protein, partial [Anaerolineales bacterium]|nr:tetratricopeptide repeat protein [Anaerolineales bacterium]